MVDAVQGGRAVGHGRGDDRREAGPHVGDGHLGAPQLGHAPHDRRVLGVGVVEAARGTAQARVEQLDLAAHQGEGLDVAEAVLVDRLVDDRHALGLGHQHDEGRLPVGHEPRVRVGLDRGRAQPGVGAGLDVVVGDLEPGAHLLQRVDGRDQAILGAAADPHLAAGHQPGDEVGERLEAIALQAGLGPAEPVDALDDDATVGLEPDAGAHALEEQRQLGDLGLDRGVAQHGAALGEHGGEQHALGGADARVGERDLGAVQVVGLGGDAVVGDRDRRAHALEGLDVEVDRASPDAVAADEGHERLVVAGEQGPEQQDRDAVEAA